MSELVKLKTLTMEILDLLELLNYLTILKIRNKLQFLTVTVTKLLKISFFFQFILSFLASQLHTKHKLLSL